MEKLFKKIRNSLSRRFIHLTPQRLSVAILVMFFILNIIKGIYVLDPDFGWHIRNGEIILKSGIPAIDQYSYTMAHYPVIFHEWLTDIFLGIAYQRIGMVGLVIVFSALALLSLFVSVQVLPKHMRKWQLVPLLLSAIILFGFVGIRPQVVSWLLFAVLIRFMFAPSLFNKYWFFVPVLFVVWVNLHGAFSVGLVILALIIVFRSIEKRRIQFKELFVIITSVLVATINPYGLRIWTEIWTTITDQTLRLTISEWRSAIYMDNYFYYIFVTLSLLLIIYYRSKFTLTELGIYLFLLIAGIISMRHVPLWIIIAIPVTTKALYFLNEQALTVKEGGKRFSIAYKVLFITTIFLCIPFLIKIINDSIDTSEKVFYPSQAITYLTKNTPTGQILAPYNWNGYLIWKLPDNKVFIHGMMPSWRNHNYPGESRYAFADYLLLLSGCLPLDYLVEKHGISTLLIPTEHTMIPNKKSIHLDLGKISYRGSEKDSLYAELYKQAKTKKWKKVYQDKVAVIYQRQ